MIDEGWTVPVTLSTSPSADPTHWKQTVIVLPEDSSVETDEILGWEIKMAQSSSNKRQYALQLEILDPSTEEHPTPCNCEMAKCALIKALMEKEEAALNTFFEG